MAGEFMSVQGGREEGSLRRLAALAVQSLGAVFARGQEGSSRFKQSIAPIARASTTFHSVFHLFQSMSVIASAHRRSLQGNRAKGGRRGRTRDLTGKARASLTSSHWAEFLPDGGLGRGSGCSGLKHPQGDTCPLPEHGWAPRGQMGCRCELWVASEAEGTGKSDSLAWMSAPSPGPVLPQAHGSP